MLRLVFVQFNTATFFAINDRFGFLLNARSFLGPRPYFLTTTAFSSCCDHLCDMLRPYLSAQNPYKTRTTSVHNPYKTRKNRTKPHQAVRKRTEPYLSSDTPYHNSVGGCSCHDDDFWSSAGKYCLSYRDHFCVTQLNIYGISNQKRQSFEAPAGRGCFFLSEQIILASHYRCVGGAN